MLTVGIREQGTGNREQGTGNREQGTGNREQGTGNSFHNSPPKLSVYPFKNHFYFWLKAYLGYFMNLGASSTKNFLSFGYKKIR
jgi:hypothetical protein